MICVSESCNTTGSFPVGTLTRKSGISKAGERSGCTGGVSGWTGGVFPSPSSQFSGIPPILSVSSLEEELSLELLEEELSPELLEEELLEEELSPKLLEEELLEEELSLELLEEELLDEELSLDEVLNDEHAVKPQISDKQSNKVINFFLIKYTPITFYIPIITF